MSAALRDNVAAHQRRQVPVKLMRAFPTDREVATARPCRPVPVPIEHLWRSTDRHAVAGGPVCRAHTIAIPDIPGPRGAAGSGTRTLTSARSPSRDRNRAATQAMPPGNRPGSPLFGKSCWAFAAYGKLYICRVCVSTTLSQRCICRNIMHGWHECRTFSPETIAPFHSVSTR